METILAIMASGIRFSIPYTLAGLGGTYSERSGVVNIGLEGMMLIGAFTAVAVSNATGSAWLGLLAAIFAGMLLGVIHGVVCVTFKADQIVSGLAIIIFAAGITVFFAWLLFNQTQIKSEVHLRVPLLHDIPAFKVLFSEIQPMVFLTALVVIVSHFIIFKTVFGLRLRAVGEHPQAADISAGRGFIGLAAMIFGKWTPFGTAGAGLLFGFGEALKPYLPKVVPSQFIDMIPYVLTIFVLASAVGRATPPAAIGIPYIKE
jgi:simple sugar transport system permease protein